MFIIYNSQHGFYSGFKTQGQIKWLWSKNIKEATKMSITDAINNVTTSFDYVLAVIKEPE